MKRLPRQCIVRTISVLAVVAVLSSVAFRSAIAHTFVERKATVARIVAIESRWNRCSVEVIRFSWLENAEFPHAEVVHYLQFGDRFREHIFKRSSDPQSKPEMKIRQWDGKLYTTIVPEVEVERRESVTPQRPTSQPYGAILKELGFTGTLEQFVSEETSNEKLQLLGTEVSLDDPSDGLLQIKRRSRLPGAANWKVIELNLDRANGLLPHSGRAYELAASDGSTGSETAVSVVHQQRNENLLHYDLIVTNPAQLRENVATQRVSVRVRAEQLGPDVEFEQIRVRELVGNPVIRQYDDNGLTSQQRFRPSPEPAEEPWPVFDQWLLINDVFLTLFVIVMVAQVLIRRSRKQN